MAAEWKETLETEREISAFMLELGIPAHLRGYYYLREAVLLSEGGGFAGCLGYGTGWQRDEAVISGDRKALQNNASAGGTRDPKRGGGVLGTGQSGGV